MSFTTQEIGDKLLEIRQKSLATETAENPVEEPVAEQPSTDQPPAEPLKVEKETPEIQTPTTSKVENVEESWDADNVTEAPKAEAQKLDFSWVRDLELGEVTSIEELKAKVTELKSSKKQLEDAPLTNVPEEFREVIEVAKIAGEDWRDYMSQSIVDYQKVDPTILFEDEFFRDAEKNPRYFTEGKFDEEKANVALDAIPEALREYQGKQIAYGKTQQQLQIKANIKAKAQAKLQAADQALNQATKNLSEILPVEAYGIKFEPKHATEIYTGVQNSKLTKKHLGLSYEALVAQGADMKAVVRTVTLAEKGEKMIAWKSKNSEAKAKSDILKSTQNAQINGSSSTINPEDPEKKVKSPKELIQEHMSANKKGL